MVKRYLLSRCLKLMRCFIFEMRKGEKLFDYLFKESQRHKMGVYLMNPFMLSKLQDLTDEEFDNIVNS